MPPFIRRTRVTVERSTRYCSTSTRVSLDLNATTLSIEEIANDIHDRLGRTAAPPREARARELARRLVRAVEDEIAAELLKALPPAGEPACKSCVYAKAYGAGTNWKCKTCTCSDF